VLERSQQPEPVTPLFPSTLEQVKRPAPQPFQYACRHLQRWQLGTSYPAIVSDVQRLLKEPPLRGSVLAVDGTGCGRPVVDLFRHIKITAKLIPILITAGHTVTSDSGYVSAPKRELVSVVQVLLQSRRLQIAKGLPEAATLTRELRTFKVKVNAATGHETFESWRERDHDDLVLAVAMAAWLAERQPVGFPPRMMMAGPVPLRREV